jgi:hypothetical protein
MIDRIVNLACMCIFLLLALLLFVQIPCLCFVLFVGVSGSVTVFWTLGLLGLVFFGVWAGRSCLKRWL